MYHKKNIAVLCIYLFLYFVFSFHNAMQKNVIIVINSLIVIVQILLFILHFCFYYYKNPSIIAKAHLQTFKNALILQTKL